MANHHDIVTTPTTPISNRKLCYNCSKRVYLHQPILYCPDCTAIFHGKCLGLSNNEIFNLQQVSWKCVDCSLKLGYIILCNNCNLEITTGVDKFSLCNSCGLIHHKNCIFKSKCTNCIPEFIPNLTNFNISVNNSNFTIVNNKEFDYNELQ